MKEVDEAVQEILTEIFSTALVASALRLGTPLILATVGEIYAQRSGVLNLGVEGMMIVGALVGFIGVNITGNPWMGILLAALCGGAMSLIHAFLSITTRSDQVISGFALSIFGIGVTSYIGKKWIGMAAEAGFYPIYIRGLSDLPIVGPILFSQNVLVYLAFFIVAVSSWILFKTRIGLIIRAVGENPEAADILGVNVYLTRYLCVFFGGIMAGIAGAYLSLAYTRQWVELMTAGRGWIAIALVIFGMWNPVWSFAGSLFFGVIDSFQLRLQAVGIGIPYNLLMMMPYVLTILALSSISTTALAKKIGAPTALLTPYVRGEKT